jgi:hypothetical protein
VSLLVHGVAADKVDAATIGRLRDVVMAELQRLAKLPDGDAELVAFNQGVQSRATDLRRRLTKLLDTPPGFGLRDINPDLV